MDASKRYIVVFDDEQGVCAPMGRDPDCDGAIFATSGSVVLFASRRDARRAIRISTAYAKLMREQGKMANSDFLDCLRNVRIVPCEEY